MRSSEFRANEFSRLTQGFGLSYFRLKDLIMFIISMPATSVIYGLDALLKVLQCNSFKDSCNGVADTRINISLLEHCRRFYKEGLKHMVLRDCVKNGEMLGAELYDSFWLSIVSCDHPSQTEMGRIINCNLECWNGRARKK